METEAVNVQVESYSNLAEPVLDAMRNLTPLAFDILTFLIVDRLASSRRPKLKARPAAPCSCPWDPLQRKPRLTFRGAFRPADMPSCCG